MRRRIADALSGVSVRLTLFGSCARGRAEPDADLDVMVEIDRHRVAPGDRRCLRRIANAISLETGIVVAVSRAHCAVF